MRDAPRVEPRSHSSRRYIPAFSGRRVLSLLVVTLWLTPCLTRAAGPEGVRKQISEVARFYEALEYEDALLTIDEARTHPHSREEQVTLLLYEGILLLEMGRNTLGRTAFVSALELDREAWLPVPVAPKIEVVFDSARRQVRSRPASLPPTTDVPRQEVAAVRGGTPAALAPVAPGPAALDAAPRRHALIPAIAGGALMAAGGVSWGLSRRELGRLRSEPPVYTSDEEVRRGAARGRGFQTAGVTLLGAGLVGLGAAAGLYAFGGPRRTLAVGVGPGGASAFVGGEWP